MIKLLIWDIDQTLWDGIWVYDKKSVKLKSKIVEIIKELDSRGILQSVCSKNEEDVLNYLEELGLKQYFLYPRANWQAKSLNIANIKESLNLSRYDQIAFIDDSRFEQEEVRASFPAIKIIDAKDYTKLLEMKEFKPDVITKEDRSRRQMYKDNQKRHDIAKAYKSDYQTFLKSLNMLIKFERVTDETIDRAHQLLVRTNKWNSAVAVLSKEEMSKRRNEIWVCSLKDKIGSHGIIGIKIEKNEQDAILIDGLALSCRIAGRGLGSSFIIETINRLEKGTKIRARFKETKYNAKLHELYKFLGFKQTNKEDNLYTYELIKEDNLVYPGWLKISVEDIMLRKATEKDYPELCELAKENKFTKDFPAMSYRWGWKNKIRVAIYHDKIVGFQYYNICKRINRANSYYIYIVPSMRSRGIGTRLFSEFLKDANKAGKTEIVWLVPKKNKPAYEFYKGNNLLPFGEDKKHHRYKIKITKSIKTLNDYLKGEK